MKKVFLVLMIVACGLAFFNSFLASSHPDGLERVAEDMGFSEKAQDSFSIFGDYQLPVGGELARTGLAGLLGIGVIYLLLIGLGKILAAKKAGV